jgi:hypothetical protein
MHSPPLSRPSGFGRIGGKVNGEAREGGLGHKVNGEAREGTLGRKVNDKAREVSLGHQVNATTLMCRGVVFF